MLALAVAGCSDGPVGSTEGSPPSLQIVSPSDGDEFVQGASIQFVGTATDPEDGTLTGESVGWRSSIDGPLGSGSPLERSDLSTGLHTIRFTAVDSDGDVTHAFVDIRVLPPNDPPSVAIASPGEGDVFELGQVVTFSGSGTDPEDGALAGGALTWTSDLDGQLGTGTSFDRSDLSAGTHEITLTGRDSDDATATASLTIVVNAPPVAAIQAPADGATYAEGQAVGFSGTGEDPEDGSLAGGALVWTSSLDGAIGTGGSFQRSDLSVGTHAVTLTVMDGHGSTSAAQVSVAVQADNAPPSVVVSSPADGASYTEHQDIPFAGDADDPEDGVLGGASLVWSSSVQGQIGTGTSFTRQLEPGNHQITLQATDSEGATSTAGVAITVDEVNLPPTASITSPTDGSTSLEGTSISFSGSGSDPEDGALGGGSLVWTSSLQGQIGTGTSFSRSDLAPGNHTITLEVEDSGGMTDTESVSITVDEAVSFQDDIVPMFKDPGFRTAGGRCTDCHFDGSGLAVDFWHADADTIYNQLTSAASNDGTFGRVIPFQTNFGDLLCKITGGDVSGSSCTMPDDDMEMITSAIDTIRDWIAQGANNN